MRPLLVLLHERPLQSLIAAARFWDLPSTSEGAELVGSLYPLLTDPWQLALALERVGPLAWQTVAVLARRRTPLRPSELAIDLNCEESLILPVLRKLYSAGIVASQSLEDGPILYLPTELVRIVTRLDHERDVPLSPSVTLHELFDRLTDHELLEIAERYGMHVLPTVTTREEAVAFLTARLPDPARQGEIYSALSPRTRQLLDRLRADHRPLRVAALLAEPDWPFGELRRTIAELARWGLIWRTVDNGRLALLLPVFLTAVRVPLTSPQPIAHVESMRQSLPVATLLDLLWVLARSQHSGHTPWPAASSRKKERVVPVPERWFRYEPSEQGPYVEFLQRLVRALGLLSSDGTIDRARLAGWLRLSFPEQGRRVLRAWRFTLEAPQQAKVDRILRTVRSLAIDTWYEWETIIRHYPSREEDEHRPELLARELDWLGVLARGQTTASKLAVRLTSWGAWLLGLRSEPPPQTMRAKLVAQGCPPLAFATLTPELVWLLLRLSDPRQKGEEFGWQVSPQSVARYVAAMIRGESTPRAPEEIGSQVLRALETAYGHPLPMVWQDTLLGWFTASQPVVARAALLLRFRTSEDRERALRSLEATRWHVVPIGQSDLLFVDFEARNRARLVSILHREGFVIDWSTGVNRHSTSRHPHGL